MKTLLISMGVFALVVLSAATASVYTERVAEAEKPAIATTAFVKAVCGTDLATCDAVVVSNPGREARDEFVIKGGVVLNYVAPGATMYPADTVPTTIGIACTGVPNGKYDTDGICRYQKVTDGDFTAAIEAISS